MEWMIVAGGFHDRGGQDKANAALVRYLARRGDRVTLLGYEIDAEFRGLPNVRCIQAPRVANSTMASEVMLLPSAMSQSHRGRRTRVRVVANGGNFATKDVNWVHFVHGAWQECCAGSLAPVGMRERALNSFSRYREERAFRHARVLIANSERTKRDILRHYPVDEQRIHAVWLGSDQFVRPVTRGERTVARAKMGIDADRPVAVFVGALGKDDRKGFSSLFRSWVRLTSGLDSGPLLLVAGHGDALDHWESMVKSTRCEQSIRLLGFRTDIPEILATADVLISPVRYEAYGLNVHEALVRGISAVVSRSAGVADRYPAEMAEMLIEDPRSDDELLDKLRLWVSSNERWRGLSSDLGAHLREWTWDDMAERMVTLAEEWVE